MVCLQYGYTVSMVCMCSSSYCTHERAIGVSCVTLTVCEVRADLNQIPVGRRAEKRPLLGVVHRPPPYRVARVALQLSCGRWH